jgi:photosystem II stability/assembly factor-like uncharacterized protein
MTCTFCRWTRKDQVFRSTDGGKTWKGLIRDDGGAKLAVLDASAAPYAGSLTPHWLGDIEIDPFDPDHVMFVTGYGIWGCHDATAADAGKPTHWTFDDRGLEETACLGLVSPHEGAPLVSALGDIDGFRHDDLDASPARGRHQPSMGTTSQLDFAQNKPLVMVRLGEEKCFVSIDGAQTWRALAPASDRARGGTIALAADGGTILWSPENANARRSIDGGITWTACQGIPQGAQVFADRAAAGAMYAWSKREAKLYASTDGGATFSVRCAQGLPNHDRQCFRSVPGRAGDLWLGVEKGGLFHSTDGGATFARLGDVDNACTLGFGKSAPGRDYPAIYLVASIGGIMGVFRSDDVGATWVRINDDQHQ